MAVIALLSAPWKIGTYALGASTLALGVACFMLNGQVGSLQDQLTAAQSSLVTARNNAATLEAALNDQSKDILAWHADSQRRIAAANAALVEAQKRTRVAEQRVAVIQSRPIKGSTLQERVLDVDSMVLESVK